MRIKPGFVVGLVFVGALVGATPWLDGYYYKTNYTNLINSLSADSLTKIKITNYQQGWLSSDVDLTIDFNPPNAKTPDPSFIVTVNQHITHGPLIKDPASGGWVPAMALLQSQVHLDKKTELKLIGASTDGIAQIDSVASFMNHYASQVKTALFTVKISDTGKLSWQGATGNMESDFVNNQLQHVTSDFNFGALAIQDTSGNLSIQPMRVVGQRDCQQAILCSGSSEFSIPSVSGMEGNIEGKLTGINLKTTYGVNAGNAYDLNVDFKMAKLTMPEYTVGPASFTFAMNNMNPTAMNKLMDISRSTAEASGDDAQSQRILMLAEYNKEAPNLIMANTVINQNMSVDTSYGNFKSTAKLYWPANTPLPASSQDILKMNFKVDMRAATTLVDELVKVIDAKQDGAQLNAQAPAVAAPPIPASAPVSAVAVPPTSGSVPVVAAPAKEELANTLLDPYVAMHKVPPTMVTDLIKLRKQHLSPMIYGVSVQKMVMSLHYLPPDVVKSIAQQLKSSYTASYSESGASDTSETMITPEKAAEEKVAATANTANTPAAVAAAPSEGGQIKQQLDAMIKQGFIKQDQDDYILSVVYENGTMKVNGVVIPLPSPPPATAQ